MRVIDNRPQLPHTFLIRKNQNLANNVTLLLSKIGWRTQPILRNATIFRTCSKKMYRFTYQLKIRWLLLLVNMQKTRILRILKEECKSTSYAMIFFRSILVPQWSSICDHLWESQQFLLKKKKRISYCYQHLEHSVTKHANLTGPLRESISLRITPFSTCPRHFSS